GERGGRALGRFPRERGAAVTAEMLVALVQRSARGTHRTEAAAALRAEAPPGTIPVTARRTDDFRLRFQRPAHAGPAASPRLSSPDRQFVNGSQVCQITR